MDVVKIMLFLSSCKKAISSKNRHFAVRLTVWRGGGGRGGGGGAKSVEGDVCPVLPLLLFFPPTTMSLVNKATSKLRKFKQFHSKLFDLLYST